MIKDVLVRVDFETGGLRLADSVKLSDLTDRLALIDAEGGKLIGISALEMIQR